MSDDAPDFDWQTEARKLAIAMCEIAAISSAAIPTGQKVDAVIERGKVLGFMRKVIDAHEGGQENPPISVNVTSNKPLSEETKRLIPHIVVAVIDGLARAIEEGEHSDIEIQFMPAGETKQ